ncbi:hypothetical protein LCGC14_2501810, partial [marine sediment metagenome]
MRSTARSHPGPYPGAWFTRMFPPGPAR